MKKGRQDRIAETLTLKERSFRIRIHPYLYHNQQVADKVKGRT